jgi:hypothetical protein
MGAGLDSNDSVDGRDGEIKMGAGPGEEPEVCGGVRMVLSVSDFVLFDFDDGPGSSCTDHSEPELAALSSATMRRPRSAVLPRVTMTFKRSDSGRNFDGMLSQVLRPMMTALTVRDDDDDAVGVEVDAVDASGVSDGATFEVTFLKNAMSALTWGQGS